MFIKKLYAYNKKLCGVFIITILSFSFINYKWGITMAPIMQFGMYSKVFKLSDTVTVYSVNTNVTKVNFNNLTLFERDGLEVPLYYFQTQAKNNADVYQSMQHSLSKIGLENVMPKNNYTNHFSDSLFKKWYSNKLSSILNHHVNTFTVTTQPYNWINDTLRPTRPSTTLLNFTDAR